MAFTQKTKEPVEVDPIAEAREALHRIVKNRGADAAALQAAEAEHEEALLTGVDERIDAAEDHIKKLKRSIVRADLEIKARRTTLEGLVAAVRAARAAELRAVVLQAGAAHVAAARAIQKTALAYFAAVGQMQAEGLGAEAADLPRLPLSAYSTELRDAGSIPPELREDAYIFEVYPPWSQPIPREHKREIVRRRPTDREISESRTRRDKQIAAKKARALTAPHPLVEKLAWRIEQLAAKQAP